MIAGIFHQGSGLGNQLHRYVATRCLALDKSYDFGMIYNPDGSGKEEGFKGKHFMNIDWGIEIKGVTQIWKKWTEDTNYYNPEFNFVGDNTLIDGEFQDERYWKHHEKEVDQWLKVEPVEIPNDVCVVGFRGGEYSIFPDLFLGDDFWGEAINKMQEINPDMKFEVHTDDESLAQKFFPDFKIIHDIGINWRSMRYAKYAIIANSSFYILPRWLRNGVTIAPRYWARHNVGVWSMPQNYYSRFQYI